MQNDKGPWVTPRSFAQVSEQLRNPSPYHLMTRDEIYAEVVSPGITIEHEAGPRPYHKATTEEWVRRMSRDRKITR